jgi:hypothetical protein
MERRRFEKIALEEEQARFTDAVRLGVFGLSKDDEHESTRTHRRTQPTPPPNICTTTTTTTVLTSDLHIYSRYLPSPPARLLIDDSNDADPACCHSLARRLRIPIEKGPRPPLKRPTSAFLTDALCHCFARRPPRDRPEQGRYRCHCDEDYSPTQSIGLRLRLPRHQLLTKERPFTTNRHLRRRAFWAAEDCSTTLLVPGRLSPDASALWSRSLCAAGSPRIKVRKFSNTITTACAGRSPSQQTRRKNMC